MPARQADPLPARDLAAAAVTSPARPPLGRLLVAVAVGSIAAAHWLLGTTALRDKCTTCDEIAHLTAGCAYWKLNDYRLQPENGNLPQRWHAIPAVLTGAKLPAADNPGWRGSDVWAVGRAFFYDVGNDSRRLLEQGRAMAALWSVATCLLVFAWSRRLFGLRGAWLSLVLAALCPTMLAHGPLMTSDMCLTFFLLASTWAIWELLFEITPLRLLGGMLAIGGLFLAKMSAPVIFAVAGVLIVLRLFVRQPLVTRGLPGIARELHRPAQKFAAALVLIFACGLFAWTVVWSAYGFRYWAFAQGPLTDARFYRLGDMDTACRITGRAGRLIASLADKQLLPEAYLYGSAYVLAHQKRAAFLNGEYCTTGWRHYFLYCFAVKTPLALGGIVALAAWTLYRSRKPTAADSREQQPAAAIHLVPLAVLFVIYWLTAIQTTLNIGYRHILPIYPLLYIFAGAAGRLVTWPRQGAAASAAPAGCLAGLVLLFAAESFAAWPNYIAYFNPLLPRERAYQHLVDSNLDWGQDLPGLARWLRAHNSGTDRQRVYLGYFGNGRPAYEGIRATHLPPPLRLEKDYPLEPGLYCFSATRLQAVYEDAPGHWNRAYEERYQSRREMMAKLAGGESPQGAGDCTLTPDEIVTARSALEYLEYLRLLAFLRHRRPDAHVNHSILIFRLTQAEIDEALNGAPVELEDRPWLPERLRHL